MNKLITIMAAIALMLALAACGAKSDAGAANGAGAGTAATAADANAQQVKIEATNWKFDQPEYHVKKGQPVTITFNSKEGMHSAAISDFKVSMDSQKKTATFTPDKTGSFDIRCMIPCGTGHTNMVSKLIVE